MYNIIELMDLLSNLDVQGDAFRDLEQELEPYSKSAEGFALVEPILRLMERQPDFDFGCPGFLVHFVEKYYRKGYEEKLLESLKRSPSLHTLWMLNRIINAEEGMRKEEMLSLLRAVSENEKLEKYIRDDAASFLEDAI